MQKQKVFIPVNPKDELPDNADEKVIVQMSYGLWEESFGGIVKNNSELFRTWLKEQEGYFFTADQLKEFSVNFKNWCDKYSFEFDFRAQRNHSNEEYFHYYIQSLNIKSL